MVFNDQSRPSLARGVRQQLDKITGEPMLLFPEGVLYLSATANDILTRCNGRQSFATIVSSLAEEYEADPETLRLDVLECLTDLHQRKLMVIEP